jgi:hypothetical protein
VSRILIGRLATIREEFDAARAAVGFLERTWSDRWDAPEIQGVSLSHVRRASNAIESTYVVRVFSEFEGILLQYWASNRPGVRGPRTAQALIDRVARSAGVQASVHRGAHEVREWRNAIVHPAAIAPPLSFREALSRLNHFLTPLPDP